MDDVRPPQPAPDIDKSASPRPHEDAPPTRGKSHAFLALFLVLALMASGGFYTWWTHRNFESTDDAFIDAHASQMAAQIGGRVIALLVRDNETVRAGQKLLLIDPRDAQVRLQQSLAQQAQAVAQREQARATLEIRQADLGQAAANVRMADADRIQAQQDFDRYRSINPRAITKQLIDSSTAALRSAQAKLEANRQAVTGMHAQIAAAEAALAAADAAVQSADADVANARLQLSYTTVVAPAPGRITRRTVELGNMISVGQPLLAIVQPGMWVTANFKETQLDRMHPGQKVKIHIDAFPDEDLDGHVDSLQAGTGSVFSSLPAENATGNYVKVIQRVPVKILFDGDAAWHLPLAPGMSVTPSVDVH